MNIDNSENRAVEQMRQKIAKAQKKITILKRDKHRLKKNWKLVYERIQAIHKIDSGSDEMIVETLSFSDYDHVE